MLNEGTATRTPHEIAEVFDFYGAYFNPVAEKDNAFVTLFTLNKYLENTLPTYFDAVMNSTMPEKELDTVLQRRLNNYLIESEKTSFLAREAFFENLFGANHPYGIKIKKEYYSEINRNDLMHFYKNHYQTGDFELILSGQITDKVLNQVEKTFGNIEVSETTNSVGEISFENKSNLIVIEKADAVQSSIRMGLPSVTKLHPDYIGLKILTTIFGGYFGSRLMKNIREEKGYTYGIHAMLVSLSQSGYIAVAADVKANHAKDAIVEIKNEIVKLQTELISPNELALVKNYMMGELLQNLDGPMAISEAYKGVIQFGYGFNFHEDLKTTILNITSEKLMELARRYLDIEKMTTVVAGKY